MKYVILFAIWVLAAVGSIMGQGFVIDSYKFGSLISHWNFEEGSGTTANDIVDSNNGTISSATYSTGVVGTYCLAFDGSNDYVTLTSVPTYISEGKSFTFTLWVKVPSILGQNNERIVYMCESTTTERVANIVVRSDPPNYNAKVWFAVRTNGSASQKIIGMTNEMSANTWVFVACIWNASTQTVTMYINDAVAQSGTAVPPSLGATDIAMRFGSRSTTTDSADMLDGSIDDIRLYNKILTTTEISAIYNE